MRQKHTLFSIMLVLSLLMSALGVGRVLAAALPLVDDFENGLPTGADPNAVAVGFVTFNDPNSTVAISTTPPPAPVPGLPEPNSVLKMDVNVVSYAPSTVAFFRSPES